jgi:CheY-like chemotaxis protein
MDEPMHRILVIDDERDVRDGIERVLVRAGFGVRTIENAAAALLQLRHTPADVVITDIIMPKLNGVEAIEILQREFPAVRIVAISGGGNFEMTGFQHTAITTSAHLSAVKRAGAHVILTKPFESAELIEAVRQALRPATDPRRD